MPAPAPEPAHAPPRRIVADFSPFAAPGMSVAEAGAAPAPHMDSYRSRDPMDDDGDDEMDEAVSDDDEGADASGTYFSGDDGQRLGLRQGTISLGQARRLATQSVARRQFT